MDNYNIYHQISGDTWKKGTIKLLLFLRAPTIILCTDSVHLCRGRPRLRRVHYTFGTSSLLKITLRSMHSFGINWTFLNNWICRYSKNVNIINTRNERWCNSYNVAQAKTLECIQSSTVNFKQPQRLERIKHVTRNICIKNFKLAMDC